MAMAMASGGFGGVRGGSTTTTTTTTTTAVRAVSIFGDTVIRTAVRAVRRAGVILHLRACGKSITLAC